MSKLSGLNSVNAWILSIIVLANLIRFVGLERNPPGFYVDEAINAANIICMRTQGTDIKGVSAPLFANAAPGGGFTTPPMIAMGVIWTSAFGDTIGSFRALSAFATVVTIGAVGALAALLAGPQVGLWTALVASVSPWAWVFSRISWDPPLMPMFLALGLLILGVAWRRVAGRRLWLMASSVCLALSAYSYAPGRLVLPLLIPAIVLVSAWLMSWRWRLSDLLAWAVPGLIASIPLILFMQTREGSLRAQVVGVFAPHTMERMGWTLWSLPGVLLNNLFLHLDPRFLLLEGDQNLRHSVAGAQVALTTVIDAAALIAFIALALALLVRSKQGQKIDLTAVRAVWSIAILYLLGALFFLPAAVTWEGLPHALRSISVWPFWTAATGGVIALLVTCLPSRFRTAGQAVSLAAVVLSTVLWMPAAVTSDSSAKLGPWFDWDVVRAAQTVQRERRSWQDFESFADRLGPYLEESRIYHRMVYGGMSCAEAMR